MPFSKTTENYAKAFTLNTVQNKSKTICSTILYLSFIMFQYLLVNNIYLIVLINKTVFITF